MPPKNAFNQAYGRHGSAARRRTASVTTPAAAGSNFAGRRTILTALGDTQPKIIDTEIADIIYPTSSTQNEASFNSFIIFKDVRGRKFKGVCIPLYVVHGIHFAWTLRLEVVPTVDNYGHINEMKRLISCEQKPLTLALLRRLYMYQFKYSTGQADLVMDQLMRHFTDSDQLYDLLPDAQTQHLEPNELMQWRLHGDLKVDLDVLATYPAFSELYTTCRYFGPEQLTESLLRSVYGNGYKSIYSPVEINDVSSRLATRPYELFFNTTKLVCMPRIPSELLYSVGTGAVELSNEQRLEQLGLGKEQIRTVFAYNFFHRKLQQAKGTCLCESDIATLSPNAQTMMDQGILFIANEKHPYAVDCTARLVYDRFMYDVETRIVNTLHTLTQSKPEALTQMQCNRLLNSRLVRFDTIQKQAIIKGLVNPLSILSGKAGTGKSTVISTLAHILFSELNYDVLVTTVTGSVVEVIADMLKSSIGRLGDYEVFTDHGEEDDDDSSVKPVVKRNTTDDIATADMKSFIVRDKLTGRTIACTTHRRVFYKVLYESGGHYKKMAGNYFERHDRRKVAVIVDEANMFNNLTFHELLISAGDIDKLMLVGDPNQLRFRPEEGNPFCEIIKRFMDDGTYRLGSDHALWTELQTNHRVQNGNDTTRRTLMLRNQDAIIDRHPERLHVTLITFPRTSDSEEPCAWTRIESDSIDAVKEACNALIEDHSQADFLRNTIIVTYRRNDVQRVNDAIFNLLFPGKTARTTTRASFSQQTSDETSIEYLPRLHKGERVVFKSKPNSSNGPKGVKNGTIGIIKGIYMANKNGTPNLSTEKEYIDENVFASQVILLTKVIRGKNTDICIPLKYFRPEHLERGYASTVHVFEGSQAAHVIFYLAPDNTPVSRSYYKLMERELIYTAVTRATESVCIVARWNDFCSIIKNPSTHSTNNLHNKLTFGDDGRLHYRKFHLPSAAEEM